MTTLLIATKNAGKAREYAKMLQADDIEIKTLTDYDQPLQVKETGHTFEENAMLKAKAAVQAYHVPVLADDSGLEVNALNGAPGIYSARYAGDHDDAANNAKLLRELKGVPEQERTAHFHTTIVALKPNGAKLVANGQVDGRILEQPVGHDGFGYDPLFYVPSLKKSMGQLTMDEKDAISHRGQALANLMKDFESWWQA